jgi:hypothetical protein
MGHHKGKLAANNHELLNLSGLGVVQLPVDEEEVPCCEVGLTNTKTRKMRKVRIPFRGGKIERSADASRDGHIPYLPLLI